MFAIEFQTSVKDGTIEIPESYKGRLTGAVRVIILAQDQPMAANLVDQLLARPIKLDDFEPLSREELYARH